MTVNSSCTVGITATSVGGTVGASFTYSLHVVDSLSNTFNTGNFTNTVIQPCGPPNYGCARAIVNDNCVIPLFGAGVPSPTGCAPTATSIPNLNNGSSTCVQGTNCSATDPQYNNILMTRCTDAQLNGTITSGAFLNRTYQIGQGSSGDTNAFSLPLPSGNGEMLAVLDSGDNVYIETIDTVNHTCYPLVSSGTTPFQIGPGEFGGTTPGHYYSFFPGTSYTVNLYNITCTTPGHSGTPCTAPGSSTVVADFSQVFPGVTATAWAPSTSYSYGQYVTVYLPNSQSSGITAATCTAGTVVYTVSPGLTTLKVGQFFNVSGLSTFNGTAFTATARNGTGTQVTAVTGCSTGSITGASGTINNASNVLFQDVTSGTHTSGGTAPTWITGSLLNTTDSAITWMASGTTNFFQGNSWTSIGGVSVDETKISAGLGNNNFDSSAKGALNVTMSNIQNTGFLVYTYDITANIYYEWNTGSAISKSFTCTGGTGPTCSGGTYTIAVMGQMNPTSTVPCTNVAPFGASTCQFYVHNVKTQKGGAWNDVTPEFCSSKVSGPGNCPSTSKYFWSKGTTTVNMLTGSAGGHETERFTLYSNCANISTSLCQIRYVTAGSVFADNWTNTSIGQFDAHWGWYYLNGSTDDTTTTPFGGTSFNNYDYPYHSVLENEVLVVSTCGVTTPITTPGCSGTELGRSNAAREGHCWMTGASNQFNPANCISAFSQDGTMIAVTTDYACQFGATTGGVELCGFPWSQSFTYANNSTIQPTETSAFKPTNAGGFVYQNQSGSSCISGTTQPTTFAQNVVINGAVTNVANAVGGSTVYNGTFPGGASNGFVGYTFQMSSFSHSVNNGTFTVSASSASALTVNNASGVSDTSGLAYGPGTTDGSCNWINVGVGNQRADAVLFWLK